MSSFVANPDQDELAPQQGISPIQQHYSSPYLKRPRGQPAIVESDDNDSSEPQMSVLISRTHLSDDPECTEDHTTTTTAATAVSSKIKDSVPPFQFISNTNKNVTAKITMVRLPPCHLPPLYLPPACDATTPLHVPTPLQDPSMQKYWKQRRRLFSKFDQGIQLDQEGWFSVTPEQIADHTATVATEMVHTHSITVLDAFGGCGGNSIAFCKRPEVEKVISVDMDRKKLQLAAHNASIYGIPPHKIVFLECNAIFVLQFCYARGDFVLDQPIQNGDHVMKMMAAMPPPVTSELCCGYTIGGIDELPRNIHLVFMDPPWGGVDYNSLFGKNGYSLQDNMRIPCPQQQQPQVSDNFFDSFSPSNERERKAAFNCGLDETNCVDGAELLAFAASAAPFVVYDIPKNTNRSSLAQAALDAGYRGNCRLDEHYLNGRPKTVSAYFGVDWGKLLRTTEDEEDGT